MYVLATMRRIAVVNQKGGVGKTSTTVNLAAAWGELGRRVLVVDLGPQAHASHGLGLPSSDDEQTLYETFTDGVPLQWFESSANNVSVVRSSGAWLARLERGLAGEAGAEMILRDAIEALPRRKWDVVMFDCPPSLGFLVVSALVAARTVVVALEPRGEPMDGLKKLLRTIDLVQKRLNAKLRIEAFAAMRTNPNHLRRIAKDCFDSLERHFPDVPILCVRDDVSVSEAWSHGQPVVAYQPNSRAAEDYLEMARRLQ